MHVLNCLQIVLFFLLFSWLTQSELPYSFKIIEVFLLFVEFILVLKSFNIRYLQLCGLKCYFEDHFFKVIFAVMLVTCSDNRNNRMLALLLGDEAFLSYQHFAFPKLCMHVYEIGVLTSFLD